MHRSGREPDRVARAELDALERVRARAGVESGPAGVEVESLVLPLVVLEAERLARPDDEHLAAVAVGEREMELVAPGLLDAPGLDAVAARAVHVATGQPGCTARCSSAARSSLGVFTVSQVPSCR